MPLTGFDHVNLRTRNLQAMIRFYSDVLGLKAGPRPRFAFDGAWMYCNGQALVHLVQVDKQPAAVEPRLEHFALKAEDLDGFTAGLERAGVDFEIIVIPDFNTRQVHFADPDGNHIHVDFAPDQSGE